MFFVSDDCFASLPFESYLLCLHVCQGKAHREKCAKTMRQLVTVRPYTHTQRFHAPHLMSSSQQSLRKMQLDPRESRFPVVQMYALKYYEETSQFHLSMRNELVFINVSFVKR